MRMGLSLLVLCLSGWLGAALAEPVNPLPRPLLMGNPVTAWEFRRDAEGWRGSTQTTLAVHAGVLVVESTGDDPNLSVPLSPAQGPLVVQLRARSTTAGSGEIFWSTTQQPGFHPSRARRFALKHDGQWHEYTIHLDTQDQVDRLRIDPGSAPGRIEIDWVRLSQGRLHPLEIRDWRADAQGLSMALHNHGEQPLQARLNGRLVLLPARGFQAIHLPAQGQGPFEQIDVHVVSAGLPALRRSAVLVRPDTPARWVTCQQGDLTLRVSEDGQGALLLREGQLVATLAPLLSQDGRMTPLALTDSQGDSLRLTGPGVSLALQLAGDQVHIDMTAQRPSQGPVVRAHGDLRQGLLAGLEYLGRGESSSSTLDIRTPEHLRHEPTAYQVTMPLMAMVTDRAAMALHWQDMTLQPSYATPNFLDGASDHRMALTGRQVKATLRVAEPQPMEELILWAVQRQGLPALPQPPRDRQAQRQLAIDSLEQVLADEQGWGHAAETRWARRPYVDVVSTFWRLGKPVDPPKLVGGGAHLPNDAGFFLTKRAGPWLAMRGSQARAVLAKQRPDGSFRYEGRYAQGHHEDTASGYCAVQATLLLEYARHTGDQAALRGGVKALRYMTRFQTPRGAQTHELPLHTPDLLGSAYLVWAYVRGYELTGDDTFLREARRWALSGVPFVYLWDDQPVMRYATIAAYGATDWYEPNWIGLPVQWCGVVYAYALAMLAPHEHTLDWSHLARGILITGQQMQYPDGPLLGCLPDFFLLPEQRRAGPSINPCALISLEMALDGQLDALAVATERGRRVTSPFPVTIRQGVAVIQGQPGVHYQVLVDGHQVIDVHSQGEDRLKLPPVATGPSVPLKGLE